MLTARVTRTCQVFLLAMSVLTLEVALTRIFSFIMFHHFTYLVISVAMLGFGAAGTYLTRRETHDDPEAGNEFLARNAWLLGLTTIAAIVFIPRIHFYPMDMYFRQDYSNLLSLLIIVVLAGTPFFFGGVCIGYIISGAGSAINRVYFADLAGAATGCLLALVLINQLGGMATCLAVTVLGMVVAAISTARRRRRCVVGLLLALLLTAGVARTEFLPMYAPPNKQMFRKEHLVELIKWHVITRLDVTRPVDVYYSFGGALSHKYSAAPQRVRVIYQDASALTGIIQPTPTPRETLSLGYYLQGAPYKVKPQADALVIGCGGGVDVLIALHHGARHVVGVDVNPNMIEFLQGRYADFAGNIHQREDVELVVSEGRHFLSRDRRRFDVIQLSGVDTLSALSTGAYALSENFIYTVEAFDQYLAHLKDDGIVNISRPLGTPPGQTLRLVTIGLEALQRMGTERPCQHLMILAGQGQTASMAWAQLLIKRSPFRAGEVEVLTRWTASLGFDVIYDPYTRREGGLETLIRAGPRERARFIAQHQLNISPPTDDKPFFFQLYRWRDLFRMDLTGRGGPRPPLALLILLGSFAQITILSGVLILYPLYRRDVAAAQPGGRAGIFVYFASLGLAFIVVEIALLQKLTVFLGGPTYSMSITLFTILLASGLGSLLSRNWSGRPFQLLGLVIPVLVVAIIGESLLLDRVISSLMGLSFPLRALTAVILVAPMGLLMGMPFPAGLRHVDQSRPELNPWAWGINACATVMGTVVCILISAAMGFHVALVFSALVYLTGWLVFATSQRRAAIVPTARAS